MQAKDASSPAAFDGMSIPIFVDTRYQPVVSVGTRFIPDILSKILATLRHWRLGHGGAAFRIDLPNGEYEVTCRFQSNDGKAHRIELYANGRREIQTAAPDSNEIVEGRLPLK